MDVDEGTVDHVLHVSLKIVDNYEKLLTGDIGLEDLDCGDVVLTYRLYMLLSEGLEKMGVNLQSNLPQVLRAIDPDIVLPTKISNFSRKVKKTIENNANIHDEVITGIYSRQGMPEDLLKLGFTMELIKQGTGPGERCNFKMKHALSLRKIAIGYGIPFSKVYDILCARRDNEEQPPDINAVRTQLASVHRRQQKLQHLCHHEEWQNIMEAAYKLPSKRITRDNTSKLKEELDDLSVRLINSYRQVATLSHEMTQMAEDAQLQQGAMKVVNTRYFEMKKKYNETSAEIKKLKEKLASLTPRNVTKRLKRRDSRLDEAVKKVEAQEEVIQKQERHIEFLNQSLETIKNDKFKLQKSRSYLKKKAMLGTDKEATVSDNKDFAELENSKLMLEEQVQELMQEKQLPNLKLMEGGRYTDDIRQVYMDLLSMGVPINKIQGIVRSVLEGIVHVGVDRLPGKTSASMMAVEAQVLGQVQAAEAMMSACNNTLHLDGTRKKFREYSSFQVSTTSGSYSLGVSEMLTGDAESYLKETIQLLEEMSEAICEEEEQEMVKVKLLKSIKNIMTDRHIVNKKFATDLETMRREIFEELDENWKELSQNQQEKLAKVNGLYCGLHVLANMATAAQKGLSGMSEDLDVTCSTLLHQTSKALTSGGNQQCGAGEEYRAFLEGKGEKNFLAPFAHNRFNILFHNGGALFYHREHIIDFLTSACPNNNKLLKAIITNLSNPELVSQCQALGMVDKIITGPLFRIVEQKNVHLFSVNDQWRLLANYLEQNSLDPTPLLNGQPCFTCEAATITKDVIYQTLYSSPIDETTKKYIKSMCNEMNIVVRRQLLDQLPGGKFHSPSEDTLEATRSAPLTNKLSESDFSDLDRMVHNAPQKSTVAKSAAICFTKNKASKWLMNLPPSSREKYMKKARQLAPKRKRLSFDQMKTIRQKRRDLQKARIESTKKALEKRNKRQADLKRRVEKTGVLTCEDQVKTWFEQLPIPQRYNVMKDQMLYHKLVLNSTIPQKCLGQLSVNGKQYTAHQLKDNLITIIQTNWHDGPPPHVVRAAVVPSEAPVTSSNTSKSKKRKAAKVTRGSNCHSLKLPTNLKVGSYVAVAFDNAWFPGQILHINTDEAVAEIMYMHPSGMNFIWPRHEDKTTTDLKYIFATVAVESRDSLGRMWSVEDREQIQKLYVEYTKAYFR
jgi:hypothetical protein